VIAEAEPIPVVVTNPAPVPVVIASPASDIDAPATTTTEQNRQSAGERLALRTAAPTTTEEQERVSAGQRNINLIWENTQRSIAMAVIGASLVVSMSLSIFGRWLGSENLQLAANVFLFGVANLVTGFYFGRTNHQRQGGVGGSDLPGSR